MTLFGWITVLLYLVVLVFWLLLGWRVLTGRMPGRSAKMQLVILTVIVAGLTFVQAGQFSQ